MPNDSVHLGVENEHGAEEVGPALPGAREVNRSDRRVSTILKHTNSLPTGQVFN